MGKFMRQIDNRGRPSVSRRAALRGLAGFLAASPLLPAQLDPFRDHTRVPSLNELLTAFDFEPIAYARLPRDTYDFTATGTEGEFTLRRNRQAFEAVTLLPRGVSDVRTVHTATEIFGQKLNFPILIAPSSGHMELDPQGELATHRAATAASNTVMIVSSVASFPIDQIAATATGPLWFQLYPPESLDQNRELLDRAQAAGCQAVAVTVDTNYNSLRERPLHNRNLAGARSQSVLERVRGRGVRPRYGATAQRPHVDWQLLDGLRSFTKVPLLAKGILTAADALLCLEHGLDGILISNHGGRYPEYAPATLEALPEIVEAVQGRVPVLIDGGFRRGADVLKALALGAAAVCLGRVPRWGLAAYGAAGAQRILEIVQGELVLAMAHTGRPTIDSIDRTLVRTDFL
jgi:4-hydroxymandelate oxidase